MKLNAILLFSALPVLFLSIAAARTQEKKAPEASGTYEVDKVHSTVIFKCKHLDTSWAFGRFNDVAGEFTFDAAKPESGKVDITIQMASVDTNSKKRDEHLKSPDFFGVEQFPTATFKSKSIAKKGDKMFAVTGDLSLHGVTKSVTIDMEQSGMGENQKNVKLSGFYGTLVLQRGDYGIKFMPGALGEEVTLMISIEAAAK